jgi:hypothetical protein
MGDTVDGVLRTLQDRLANIDRHAETQDHNLSSSSPFDTSAVKNELENDLQQIQQSLMQLSRFCMNKMTASSTSMQKLEIDLEHVEGTLKTIRANAGRQLVIPPLPPGVARAAESSFLPRTTKINAQFPSYDFELNIGALEGVGRKVEEDDTGAPLNVKLDPGAPQPLLWAKTNDFFLPTKPTSGFATSFSEFYGFDGSSCFAAKERSAKALAEQPPPTSAGATRRGHHSKRKKSASVAPDAAEPPQGS